MSHRWKSLLAVGLSLALALLSIDAVLATVFGEKLGWAAPAMSSTLLDDWGQRIARVERMQADGEVSPGTLVAVLGMSTVREGLDSSILTMRDPQHRHWLILGAAGGNIIQLQQYSLMLSASQVRPAVVVLGIHRSMLQDEEVLVKKADVRKLASEVRRGEMMAAAREARLFTWFGRHDDEVSNWAFMTIHHARLALERQQRLGLDAIYRAMEDPWSVNSTYRGPRAAPADLALQLEGLRSQLRPERSASLNLQVTALAEIVHRIRQLGARAVCLLMPESSEYRSLYSPAIEAMLDRALRLSAQDQGVSVIDLHNALEDILFYDYAHLNAEGRRRLSELLPRSID